MKSSSILFFLFFVILSFGQNTLNNTSTIQYSILKDPLVTHQRDFRAQTIRDYDITSQMITDIQKPLYVPPIFNIPQQAINPIAAQTAVAVPLGVQNVLKVEPEVLPIDPVPKPNSPLKIEIQPADKSIFQQQSNQTVQVSPTQSITKPIQSAIVKNPQAQTISKPTINQPLIQKSVSPQQNNPNPIIFPVKPPQSPGNPNSIPNIVPQITNTTSNPTTNPNISNSSNSLNKTSLTSIIDPSSLSSSKPSISTNTTQPATNSQSSTKQTKPQNLIWKGVPPTNPKDTGNKRFANIQNQLKKGRQQISIKNKSFTEKVQNFIQKQDSSIVTLVLFVCIIITVGTIIGVGCIVIKRRRHQRVLFIDSSAIREEIQTPKLPKGQYNPSETEFVEMVQDEDMTQG